MRILWLAAVQSLVGWQAHAASEWSDRVNMDDAGCLDGGWQNQSWPRQHTAWVQKRCSDWNAVTAESDR